MRPQTSPPTASAATADQVHSPRTACAWVVMPSGHPNPNAFSHCSVEQALSEIMSATAPTDIRATRPERPRPTSPPLRRLPAPTVRAPGTSQVCEDYSPLPAPGPPGVRRAPPFPSPCSDLPLVGVGGVGAGGSGGGQRYLDAAAGVPLHPTAAEALSAAIADGWADPAKLYGAGRRAAAAARQRPGGGRRGARRPPGRGRLLRLRHPGRPPGGARRPGRPPPRRHPVRALRGRALLRAARRRAARRGRRRGDQRAGGPRRAGRRRPRSPRRAPTAPRWPA